MAIQSDFQGQSPGRYTVDIPATDVVRWVREEMRTPQRAFGFYERAWKAYCHNSEFDRKFYGIGTEAEEPPVMGDVPTLVSVEAGLDIEPHLEQHCWILEVRVDYEVGIRPYSEESRFRSDSLSLDEFEDQFIKPGRGEIEVKVEADTQLAREHFEDWVLLMKEIHPETGT